LENELDGKELLDKTGDLEGRINFKNRTTKIQQTSSNKQVGRRRNRR
jgi:hypothetical protein